MAERMVQKDNLHSSQLEFTYLPSQPGEADDLMNAVLAGLVKIESGKTRIDFDKPISCSTPSTANMTSTFQPSDYQPYYTQPYYHQQRYIPSQPQRLTCSYSLSYPHHRHHQSYHHHHQRQQHQIKLPPASIIPSTVRDIQKESHRFERISDEKLDETLKDLGLLDPVSLSASSAKSSRDVHSFSLPPASSLQSSSSSQISPSLPRESQGQPRLFKFIISLLESNCTNPSLIEWVDRSQGIFALINPDEIARQWGVCKNNACMNYEKMSRSFRYYYKVGILERIHGKRLVYKFSSRAPVWNTISSKPSDRP